MASARTGGGSGQPCSTHPGNRQASRYVPLEQLCLSPQCGFSSTVEGNTLTAEEQAAKLRLVVETAAEVWG